MAKNDLLERRILFYVQMHEDVTMPTLALALGGNDEDQLALEIHGKQHLISQAIERLRYRGLLADVEERCLFRRRAKRTRTAVTLHLTDLGKRFNAQQGLPPKMDAEQDAFDRIDRLLDEVSALIDRVVAGRVGLV